jgi:hypothetical protein
VIVLTRQVIQKFNNIFQKTVGNGNMRFGVLIYIGKLLLIIVFIYLFVVLILSILLNQKCNRYADNKLKFILQDLQSNHPEYQDLPDNPQYSSILNDTKQAAFLTCLKSSK